MTAQAIKALREAREALGRMKPHEAEFGGAIALQFFRDHADELDTILAALEAGCLVPRGVFSNLPHGTHCALRAWMEAPRNTTPRPPCDCPRAFGESDSPPLNRHYAAMLAAQEKQP